MLDHKTRFGTSDKEAVLGEVHCVGTEPNLLQCSHARNHNCQWRSPDPDIIISCYDTRVKFLCMAVRYAINILW